MFVMPQDTKENQSVACDHCRRRVRNWQSCQNSCCDFHCNSITIPTSV